MLNASPRYSPVGSRLSVKLNACSHPTLYVPPFVPLPPLGDELGVDDEEPPPPHAASRQTTAVPTTTSHARMGSRLPRLRAGKLVERIRVRGSNGGSCDRAQHQDERGRCGQ